MRGQLEDPGGHVAVASGANTLGESAGAVDEAGQFRAEGDEIPVDERGLSEDRDRREQGESRPGEPCGRAVAQAAMDWHDRIGQEDPGISGRSIGASSLSKYQPPAANTTATASE
jgi:hypothetical protein